MFLVRRHEGQDLVEFALVAPLLFLLLFGILEFGVAVWRYNTVANAAREGARAAVNYGLADRSADAKAAACGYLNRFGIPCDTASLSESSNPRIDYAEGEFALNEEETASRPMASVTVTYQYHGVTGLTRLIASGGITLRAGSSMLPEGTQ